MRASELANESVSKYEVCIVSLLALSCLFFCLVLFCFISFSSRTAAGAASREAAAGRHARAGPSTCDRGRLPCDFPLGKSVKFSFRK